MIKHKDYFFINDILKSGAQGHHQMLSFFSLRCFVRALLQLPWVPACLWIFVSLVLSSVCEKRTRLGWGQTRLFMNIQFLCIEKLLGWFLSRFWVIIRSILLNLSRRNSFVHFTLLLLSAVTSSIHTSDPVP